jgi:hypothetical protein
MRLVRLGRETESAHAPATRVLMVYLPRPQKPFGRSWAKQLGVSHTRLQSLVRQFQEDSSEMWQLQAAAGDPHFSDLGVVRGYARVSARYMLKPDVRSIVVGFRCVRERLP